MIQSLKLYEISPQEQVDCEGFSGLLPSSAPAPVQPGFVFSKHLSQFLFHTLVSRRGPMQYPGSSQTTRRQLWQPLWRLQLPTSASPLSQRLSSATSISSGWPPPEFLRENIFSGNPSLRLWECVQKMHPLLKWALLSTRYSSQALMKRCFTESWALSLKD